MRRVVWISALWSAVAFGQSADVTGPELLSGNADQKLQAAAREAQSSGRKLVISAPEVWHDMVLEQIRKGAPDVEVELRDSFAEAVMVRGEAPAPAPAPEPEPEPTPAPVATPAPAPAPAPRPAPEPAKPIATPRPAPAPVQQPAARPAAPTPAPVAPAQPAPTPQPQPAPIATTPEPAPAPVAVPAPPPQPAATPAPQPAPVATAPAPAPAPAAKTPSSRSADAEIASIKRRLEQNLNNGEPVAASLTPYELEVNDVIYVEGPVRAVLRRASLRNALYWLDGDLELRRVELKELAGDRYQVAQRMTPNANVVLRATRTAESDQFVAAEPSTAANERTSLERRYNGGSTIDATLAPTELRQKDVLYLGDKLVVVVRLQGQKLERYWLVGTLNLGRRELIRDGNNKYKVLADIRE